METREREREREREFPLCLFLSSVWPGALWTTLGPEIPSETAASHLSIKLHCSRPGAQAHLDLEICGADLPDMLCIERLNLQTISSPGFLIVEPIFNMSDHHSPQSTVNTFPLWLEVTWLLSLPDFLWWRRSIWMLVI